MSRAQEDIPVPVCVMCHINLKSSLTRVSNFSGDRVYYRSTSSTGKTTLGGSTIWVDYCARTSFVSAPHFWAPLLYSNFSSFARQLNFYGFRKLRSEGILTAAADPQTASFVRFYHQNFQRDKVRPAASPS